MRNKFTTTIDSDFRSAKYQVFLVPKKRERKILLKK